ncbi:MAG TPA: histidine kinase [Candidatus Sulfotelmatobacter sp.]|nr:histidine kinase [Candidatus Sulfotelmatobacter sp.]
MKSSSISRSVWAALAIAGVLFAMIMGTLLVTSWKMNWLAAVLLAVPMAVLAQAVAWAAQFTCRSHPLEKSDVWRTVLTHITAALVLSYLWVSAGWLVAGWVDGMLGTRANYKLYAELQNRLYGVGFSYYLLGVAFHYMLFAQKASQEAQERALESSVRAREAELSALKAQINPHFLYNSLNSISALTSIDPARAREMCVSLADFLRLTLGMGEKTVIPLREEVSLLDKYCAIEKVRFGNRLNIQEEVQEDAKDCLLPPLLLQPLFENAVVHGIAQMAEGGWIRLRAARNGGRLSVSVENSWDPEAGSSRKNGVGLRNVQRRLEARYGTEAQLEAKAEEDVFRVNLSFPAETEKSK